MRIHSVLALFASLPGIAFAGGTVAGRVTVKEKGTFGGLKDKGDRSGVVVYLEGVPGPAPARASQMPKIRQVEKAFVPRVVAIMKGATVEFPNEDKIFHNVFSLSQVAKFDLGLYKSGTSKSVTFDRTGSVDVYCNIHPEMAATIKVVDSGWFAVTEKDGAFKIDGVPPGTYTAVAWLPRGDERRAQVTVKDGQGAQLSLEVTEASGASRHLRKDGTPYGRYE